MTSQVEDTGSKIRNECVACLLMVLLVIGMFFLVLGIVLADVVMGWLGCALIVGFVMLVTWFVNMIGGWRKVETIFHRETALSGE